MIRSYHIFLLRSYKVLNRILQDFWKNLNKTILIKISQILSKMSYENLDKILSIIFLLKSYKVLNRILQDFCKNLNKTSLIKISQMLLKMSYENLDKILSYILTIKITSFLIGSDLSRFMPESY